MVSTRNRQAATASPLRAGLEAEPRQKRTTRKDAARVRTGTQAEGFKEDTRSRSRSSVMRSGSSTKPNGAVDNAHPPSYPNLTIVSADANGLLPRAAG